LRKLATAFDPVWPKAAMATRYGAEVSASWSPADLSAFSTKDSACLMTKMTRMMMMMMMKVVVVQKKSQIVLHSRVKDTK
jgi:hypothetical protein